jgi:hypothetical protein
MLTENSAVVEMSSPAKSTMIELIKVSKNYPPDVVALADV